MNRQHLHSKARALVLSCGLLLSQVPVYAGTLAAQPAGGPEQDSSQLIDDSLNVVASAVAGTPAPPVNIRATQEVGEPPDQSKQILSGSVSNNVENLSKQILRDEVALQKFNLAFRLNAAKQGRWKGWRYFISQEGNLAATEAALVVTVTERGDHLSTERSKHLSKNILANGGQLPAAVGQAVAGFGSGLELGINEYHAIQAQHNGYGSKEARATAVKLVAQIDRDLAERERLIKREPASDQEVGQMQELEGHVLADFRDLALAEFERYHVGAKKTLAQQNSFYVLDMVKNTTGVVGNFMIMHSILRGYRVYNFSGGLLNLISGSLIVADPVISRLVGKAVENADQRNLNKAGLATVSENGDKLESDYTHLVNFCKNHQIRERADMSALVGRLDAYDANDKYCVDEIQRNAAELRRGNRTAIQNMGTAFVVGTTKMASGIITMNCGHKYFNDKVRTNTNLFAANLVYLPGVTWGLLDNVRIQTEREVRYHQMQRDHKLPGQIIHARLDQLNAIEKKI